MNAWRTAAINFVPDPDGIGRHYPLYVDIGGWRMPSLPALVARDLGVELPPGNQVRLDWFGDDPIPFQQLSYAEVLKELDSEPAGLQGFFTDQIVIIGITATGLHDLRPTPINASYPGISVLATAIENLVNQHSLSAIPWHLQWLAILAALSLMALLQITNRRRTAVAFIAALLVAWPVLSVALILQSGLLLPAITPLLTLLACVSIVLSVQFAERRRSLRDAVSVFGRFLDPEVVDRLLLTEANPESRLEGRNCRITVLFTDIRGFTTLSEQRSAVEILNLLDRYFSRQVEVIFRHKGTLDKFIGDAIMVFWGAPVENPNQESNAIEAALDMQQAVVKFREEYDLPEFDIGIGIHSGNAVVGMVGCEQRYDYTALGDSVNLASRIEGLTKDRATILVSEDTYNACANKFKFVEHGEFTVKGRKKPVKLFEPVEVSND